MQSMYPAKFSLSSFRRSVKCSTLPALILFGLSVSACSGNQVAATDTTLDGVYTSVAYTVTAAWNAAPPTVASVSLSTATPAPTTWLVSTGIPTSTPYSYSAVSTCNGSAYVSDVTIADGTELAPGEDFTKTWEFRNTGTCTWSSSYSIAFVSGSDMDGSETEIDDSVAAGSTAEVSVDLTAPDDAGTYTGYWSLADSNGTLFGEKVYVQIVVSEDAATDTPTPTSTSQVSTATETPTAIPATETPTPTNTPDDSSTEDAGG